MNSMNQVSETLDHLFRRQSGQIVAYLVRVFGPGKIEFAENVVQDALLKAAQTWPIQGIPDNPAAWITSVAKNIAIDTLRKDRYLAFDSETYDALANLIEEPESEKKFEKEIVDDQLKLLFICCHPILSNDSKIALALKTVSGFSVSEIAKAFLSKNETIEQRLVRAKQKIKENKIPFETPPPEKISERIDSVLDVFYLMFNEGYLATEGESILKRDLCEEAIRLTTLMVNHPVTKQPKVAALLALMHFQFSRFSSRTDSDGEILLLEEQDRSQWNSNHISLGLKYLDLSADGDELSTFHLQAGIASVHALAPTFESTNWKAIIEYYDILLDQNPSPVIALNRAVAISILKGPQAGLNEIDLIKNLPQLKNYHLLYGTIAELNRKLGSSPEHTKVALENYRIALKLARTDPEKRFIEKSIKLLT